jgi:hypothetical protein
VSGRNLKRSLHEATTTHLMMGVYSTTPRSVSDLLSLPLPFIQLPLLEPTDFMKECKARDVELTISLLEDLHRHKLLVPFYRVAEGPIKPDNQISTDGSLLASLESFGLRSRILLPAQEGRLTDPSRERFRLWPRDRPSDPLPPNRQARVRHPLTNFIS